MVYNVVMEKITVAVIGGGAAGLFFAGAFKNQEKTVIFERGERVGRKLAATGNGQGNVSNKFCTVEEYFSSSKQGVDLARALVGRFDEESFEAYSWRDANAADYSRLEKINAFLPEGMKL